MINRSQIYVGIGLECDSLHGRLVAVIVSFSFSQDLRVSICPVQRAEEYNQASVLLSKAMNRHHYSLRTKIFVE